MKILLVHTNYRFRGGEDIVFDQEYSLLMKDNEIKTLVFHNKTGILGLIQFILSIWNAFVSIKIKHEIKNFKPDIIHLHNWHYACGPLLIRTIKKEKVPLIITLHNYRLICPSALLLHHGAIYKSSLYSSFPWKAVKDKVYRNSFVQTFWLASIIWFHKIIGTWDKPDKYIVLTDFAKELFIRSSINIQCSKFAIKSNFVNHNKPNLNYTERNTEFLFIGRLSEEKGIKILIEAFKKSGFILNIGGDGPLKDYVSTACKQFSNIRYLGILNSDQVHFHQGRCSALIFPSIWYEGMPMTIIEAFSLGTPVIANNLGAMASMIQDEYNGLLFEMNNTDSLLAKLNEWNDKNQDEKKQFYINAYNTYLKNYSPEINKKQLMSIYQKAINNTESC